MKLVIASRNEGKIAEIRAMLAGTGLDILSLDDFPGRPPEVVEDGDTFTANARKKALAVAAWSGVFALADDSGLVVDALDGRPGVQSARFAGEDGNTEANNALLLDMMKGVPEGSRTAHFQCVMSLAAPDGRTWETDGRVDGEITGGMAGAGGFGYDPLFFYPPAGKTFAEMDPGEKNSVSHRAAALRKMAKLIPFLP
ncbi:MAG: XTP/dITP diphosphatase [Deltaproteobacteria bacterium]|nr:XTP/dITP diphosphatase [Deltaproteobacteria bacterium]